MKADWRKTLVLACTLFVLGGFAYWLEFAHEPKREADDENAKRLFVIKDTAILGFSLGGGTRTFEFKCLEKEEAKCKPADNPKWTITKVVPGPENLAADDTNVTSFLTGLASLIATETIDLSKETPDRRTALLKEYGLDPESRKVVQKRSLTVQVPGGKMYSAAFGTNHPIGDGVFALAAENGVYREDRVYLIPSYFKASLDRDLNYWRRKKVLEAVPSDVKAFALKTPKFKVAAHRQPNEDTKWMVTLDNAQEELPGDFEGIDHFLNELSLMNAKDFPSESIKSEAGAKLLKGSTSLGTLEITLKDEKAAPITVTMIEKDKKVYAWRATSSPVMEVDASDKARFTKSSKDFRLQKLLSMTDRFSIRSISLAGGKLSAPLTFKSDGNRWSSPEISQGVEQNKVSGLLEKISGNRIRDFVPRAKAPAAAFRLTLGDEKDPKKYEFSIWKMGSDLLFKDLHSKRDEAYKVDVAIAVNLPYAPNAESAAYYAAAAPATTPPPSAKPVGNPHP